MKSRKASLFIGDKDLKRDKNFVEKAGNEFKDTPAGKESSKIMEMGRANRRDFLKYLGFGLGSATLAASCDAPIKKAIPFVIQPEEIVPGVANYYASTFSEAGDFCSILVKTREGRPIKIEGNDMSPVTKGGTSARAQASVLSLYDYNRFQSPGYRNGEGWQTEDWITLDEQIKSKLRDAENIKVVSHTILSPTARKAIRDFQEEYANAEVVIYDPVSSSGLIEAMQLETGKYIVPHYLFNRADTIISFGADFLGTWISPVEYAADYISNRKIVDPENPQMSYHVQIEATMSMTGSNADDRILIRPSEQGAAIAAFAEALGISAPNLPLNDKAALQIRKLADKAREGNVLVVCDSNNVAEQRLIHKINESLGAIGTTVDLDTPSYQRQGLDRHFLQLIEEMEQGAVDVLIHLNANPAFNSPAPNRFAEAMSKVDTCISTAMTMDETAEKCHFICPQSHYLESWGDSEPVKGMYHLIQPTIRPIFNTRQAETSLLVWAGKIESRRSVPDKALLTDTLGTDANLSGEAPVDTIDVREQIAEEVVDDISEAKQPYYEYLKEHWKKEILSESTDAAFREVLHDGFYKGSGSENIIISNPPPPTEGNITEPVGEGVDLLFYESISAGGGQYTNNPWLQELPDPVTRTCWGNYMKVPVEFDGQRRFNGFNEFGDGMLAMVSFDDVEFTTPVIQQFGQPPNTVALALGYGRVTSVKTGVDVGVNIQPIIPIYNGNRQYFISNVKVSESIGMEDNFSCVQYHHTMGVTATDEEGNEFNADEAALSPLIEGFQGALVERSIIRGAPLEEINTLINDLAEERKKFHKLNSHTLYPFEEYSENKYDVGHHWMMHIDLNACIGCGACAVACIAENNVPVVGKEEVSRHHEMTWLRIDRYYYGDVENPNTVYQPMLCQHCDNAPCENVCPVNATNHSSEGLNQMAYNRCVGTRYCANNCPYKVRRFNWLDYTTADVFPWNEPYLDDEDLPYGGDNLTRMVLNPDVTVRSRGVIEKCSFCVQRIQEGKLAAKMENRPLRDEDVKTACQTACPTGAIIFGDENNPDGLLAEKLRSPLNYRTLEEVNTQPSIFYKAKITNKNNELDV